MFSIKSKRCDYKKIISLFIILFFIVAVFLVVRERAKLTGYVTLNLYGGTYYANETITGNFYLSHGANEFLPAQMIVNAKLAEKEVNLTLEQFIVSSNAEVEKRLGNFSVEGTGINGSGLGYGIEGGGTILLNLSAFNLRSENSGKKDFAISLVYDNYDITTINKKITIKSCTSSWKQYNTTCQKDDTFVAYYKDKNSCYEKTGQIDYLESRPKNLTFTCDYCEPNWKQYNTSCQQDDTQIAYYKDTKTCYSKTELLSDLMGRPDNITVSCDYCLPSWSAKNTSCSNDDTITTYYLDNKECYEKTNLNSDISDRPLNLTLVCDFCMPSWKQYNTSCNIDDTKISYYKDIKECYEKTSLNSDLVGKPENVSSQCDYCKPNWKQYNTTCTVNDTLTGYYKDYNNCYNKTQLDSDLLGRPENLTFTCDYCSPAWIPKNTSCSNNDTFIVYYKDSKSCYNKTGLDSDLLDRPENITIACDYCKPNWTAVNTCLEGDLLVIWYNDTKLCYEKTGLASDLLGRLENATEKFACDYEGNNILGTISDINTTLKNLAVYVAESSNLAQPFNDLQHVIIKENDSEILEFNFNFSASQLEIANLTIQKQTDNSSKGFIVINGLNLDLQNETKTAYVDRISNGASVCIKDEENVNVEDISAKCNGTNEMLIKCLGVTAGYVCEFNSTLQKYKISGLKHSAVIEQEAFCGDGSCNADESCSSCNVDCGECPAPQSLSETRGAVGTPSGGCLPNWECSEWSACINGKQSRQCINTKKYCPVEINKPAEEQECTSNETQSKEKAQEENITEVSTKKEVRTAGGLIGNVISAIRMLPIQGRISAILNIISLLFAFVSSIIFFRLIKSR